MIGVEEIRALMEAEGEFCFPWVIGEMIGGMDAQVYMNDVFFPSKATRSIVVCLLFRVTIFRMCCCYV